MYGSSACRGLMDSDVPGSGNSQIWSFNSLQPGYHHLTIVFTDGQVVAYDNGAPLGDPIASPELVFDEFGGDHRGEANGNANTENQLYWYALHIVSDPNYVYTEPVEVISKDEDANIIIVDGGDWRTPNDRVYSEDFAFESGILYNRTPDLAFNGDTATPATTAEVRGEYLEWTPSGGLTFTTAVEVYVHMQNGTTTYNTDAPVTVPTYLAMVVTAKLVVEL